MGFFDHKSKHQTEEEELLEDILKELKKLNRTELRELHHHHCHTHKKAGVIFYINGQRIIKMADLVLAQGDSKNISLHYVNAAGTDLGQVPPTDNPSITGDNAILSLADTQDGSKTATNANTATDDVDVNLSGSAGGFSTTAVVTVSGTGVTPPDTTPAGVKFVFA